jgi:hypothetical protein
MSRFLQAYVAPSINFFKKDFLSKYGLVEYYDVNKPAIFFGARESSELIKNHKNYKLILPCTPNDIPLISDYEKTIFVCSDNYLLPKNVIRKSITPEIKNYDIFKPNPLGDKIYFYSGFKNGWNFNTDLIKDLQKKINYEIITTSHNKLIDYHSIDYLKKNYYDKTFLNLNFSHGNGLASVIELGLMGRKTIFNPKIKNNIQRIEFPNFINYNTIDDILIIINEESKKIGTIQDPINAHNIKDEWLDLNFWL